MYDFMTLFLLFFMYSIIGYIFEVISCSIQSKKLVLSRGYLIGPYIPIFGFGGVAMSSFLDKYKSDTITLFVLSMVVCCIMEYLTSFLLEKIFKLRWWDYSNRKFNVNGRICLINGIFFGLGGLLVTQFLNPTLRSFLSSFTVNTIIVVGSILFGLIILDAIISTVIVSKLKIDTKKYAKKDSTEIIKKEVSKSLDRYRILYKRIIRAFPNIKLNTNVNDIREYIKEKDKLRKKGGK